MPGATPYLSHTSIIRSTASSIARDRWFPGVPSAMERSCGPMMVASTPGTLRISSRFSIASRVSIWMQMSVFSLIQSMSPDRVPVDSKSSITGRMPHPRPPSGGYFADSTISSTSARVLTRGIMIPSAPASRRRAIRWYCESGTRTIGTTPAARVLMQRRDADSIPSGACSVSISTKSTPARFTSAPTSAYTNRWIIVPTAHPPVLSTSFT
ncbi:MAG: hypothetical protein BWY06_03212 [Candidatus Latescibacteria bacterium ADurb.Bin168]|nr:MAG: hypothetical protein BWY06_03212 [Candidatus Latescibacteria bacterium ADurb.Bin168]